MKETIVIIAFLLLFIFGIGTLYSRADGEVKMQCRQDCTSMKAEYAHHDMGANGHTDRCSCRVNEEIKPIW